MINTVFDANVLVSGLTFGDSTPGRLLRRWAAEDFALVISRHIEEEVIRSLDKPYFRRRLSSSEHRDALVTLRSIAQTELTVPVSGVATHPEDDLILATAVSARADYLVTGDLKLRRLERFMDTAIVLPSEFMEILH